MEKISIANAKRIDLVEYLSSLGYRPMKIRHHDYWYLSPLREEKTASFKVNRQLQVWFDHGTGKGGNLVDFGTLYFNCSVADLLQRLSHYQPGQTFSFHPPTLSANQHAASTSAASEKKDDTESKIVIGDIRSLAEKSLLNYLQKRRIPMEIASRFCSEVDFHLYGKKHTAIGFKNNAGGYELRSENFKGSSAPKDVSLVDNHTEQIAVFEGFFNFLSFQVINKNNQAPLTNCLVLNSLSFLEKSRPLMEKYKTVHLILDRDTAGINHTQKAQQWDKNKYVDRSDFYQGQKDLNDWLIHQPKKLEQSHEQSQRIEKRL